MTGVLIALLSGVGFGLFQVLNRRTLQTMDVSLSTFLLMVTSTAVLAVLAVLTQDLERLRSVPWTALANFMVAGFVHFFVGWTLLNASQKRVGASRTSLMIGTVPLFGTVGAAVALRELPGVAVLIGILVVVAGLVSLSVDPAAAGEDQREGERDAWAPEAGWRGLTMGLGAALCWASSPIFVRAGLRDLPVPLLGLLIGLIPSLAAYSAVLVVGRRPVRGAVARDTLALKAVAGGLVGLSQWARWEALHLAPVGVVLSLTQIMAVTVVMAVSPFLLGRHLERVTSRVWIGAAAILGGTLLIIWYR
jgi:drug/metabolite transporter (DMT)-like permease